MILCALISLIAAIACGVLIFTSGANRGLALDLIFGLSVVVFLGSFVTAISRRAAANFRRNDPNDQRK